MKIAPIRATMLINLERIKHILTCMSELNECRGVVDADPELSVSDTRCAGLLGIAGNVPKADPLLLMATDDEIGAVGGAEIFRPITGGAGRPMLRINVLI